MQNDIIINANIEQKQNISASVKNENNISAGTTQRGAQGIPGKDGQAATIELGTVSTGAAGTDVIITNSGTSSAAVFNFTIPRGSQGEAGAAGEIVGATAIVDNNTGIPSVSVTSGGTSTERTFVFDFHNLKGEQGATGADGQDGAAATISVGTVSTGAAGTSATVVNSGTSSAAVLDFVIPQGAKGDTGANGTDGTNATITGVTASVDANVGTPSVSVTVGGTESARTFDFAFHNLKGADGQGSGTVNSVNNIQPDGAGNVTLTASDVGALSSTTTIGAGTTTITVNNTSVGSINANQTTSGSINITVPTATSDLNNDSGYITSVPTATTSSLGVVQPDGTTVTINDGVISAVGSSLPSQTGQDGRFLKTDGTNVSWATPTDTQNTCGGSNTTSKIYLVGRSAQNTGISYSNQDVYTQNGYLYASHPSPTANNTIVATTKWVKDRGYAVLPSQTGHAGDVLTTDGTDASWADTTTVYPVIETYINNGSWYKIYAPDSTGYRWCEMGGLFWNGSTMASTDNTITFLKNFKDTAYSFSAFPLHQDANINSYSMYEKYTLRTISSTVLRIVGAVFGYEWEAKGYIVNEV